ncbi:hypothetical protein KEM54_000417 [Ascosphaera aggregata]|nr:hypothetical protein KEM54_000417 [Ascosphaera aggregata]
MSTDPDTVRDNSGSLRSHRLSRTRSLNSASESGNRRNISARSDNPAEDHSHHRQRRLTTSSSTGTDATGGSSIYSAIGRPRALSVSLQAAATLNAAEKKDAITSLTPKERKSISLGAAGAGLSSTDEITTLTSTFDFKIPNFTSSAGTGSHAAATSPAAASPRNTTSLGSNNGSNNNNDGGNNTSSPMTTPTQPPAPTVLSSPSSSLSKTPSERRRSAIALNLMLSDPTLPSPGELACSDRRASISSSGMAPAWGYAQRTGSIAGSAGSPIGSNAYGSSRSISVGRSSSLCGGHASSALRGSIGLASTTEGEGRQKRMSAGDLHQKQEQEHERVVLRLFSRINALEAEVARLRLNPSHHHPRIRRHNRSGSPGTYSDTAIDTETDVSAEEADLDTVLVKHPCKSPPFQ